MRESGICAQTAFDLFEYFGVFCGELYRLVSFARCGELLERGY